MTVVATIVTRHHTAHASDSLLTVARPVGIVEVVEDEAPKLVRVPAWRGIIGYWGLAQHDPDWNTLQWLRAKAGLAHQHASAAGFARHLSESLTVALQGRVFAVARDRGLGPWRTSRSGATRTLQS